MTHPLARKLNESFKTKTLADPNYQKFVRAVKKDGLTYKIDASDGFIDLSDGRCFPHYGDWHETLERYQESE